MTSAQSQQRPEEPDDSLAGARMGFLEHLDELRTRIIRSCIAIAAGITVAFIFVDRLADFVESPVLRVLPIGTSLVFIRPGEAFSFYLDLALIGGVVLAAPFVMYQVWGFIAPGLYAKEKRFLIPFLALTTVGTLGGAFFSHYALFPAMIAFFGTFNTPKMKFMPRVEDTLDLYKTTMLGMVAVFQLPTLVFFLAKMRLVTARFLWRNIKYAILAIFVIAAVLTPSSDPWNQAVFAAPMIALYVISIGIAWIAAPRRERDIDNHGDSPTLRLVVGAMVVDKMRAHRLGSPRFR
jgi:sec-independent protein translocase protein TatC